MALNGVKDIIAAFGAVDISNVRTAQDKEPEQLAQSVADSALHEPVDSGITAQFHEWPDELIGCSETRTVGARSVRVL